MRGREGEVLAYEGEVLVQIGKSVSVKNKEYRDGQTRGNIGKVEGIS